MAAQDTAPQTFDSLSRKQLEIYANELRQHMQAERRLNGELEQRNSELEQRVREITALNQLFQQHLNEADSVVRAYREIHDGLKQLVNGTAVLERWVQSRPPLTAPGSFPERPADLSETRPA